MFGVKTKLKRYIKTLPVVRDYAYGSYLYQFYSNSFSESKKEFLKTHKFYVQPLSNNKSEQLSNLLSKVEIIPTENGTFFYSIDVYKSQELKYDIFDNYSVDYTEIVNSSFKDISAELQKENSLYNINELNMISAMRKYYKRCLADKKVSDKYKKQLAAIGSLFERPAQSFFEGLQRILFFNQFLWQTRHKHVGLGHLDWLLIDLYEADLKSGVLNEQKARVIIKEFLKVLHEKYWFKSSMLLGDTGQIIILGGTDKEGSYKCNALTYRFIEASMELRLPDPKVLLRCSTKMPGDLLELALDCMSTGIGAPFLSNDDVVIPALLSFGYLPDDACKYATSACWEPLIIGNSCDQNNVKSINFARPLLEVMDSREFEELKNSNDLLKLYRKYLKRYLSKMLNTLSKLQFEEDPLLSLLSKSSRKKGKDIVRGGADYSNLGLTSVGMGTVVNSILNINKYVFVEKKYTLKQLNEARKTNFRNEQILNDLKNMDSSYGCDNEEVVKLTKMIEKFSSDEFEKHRTGLGGKFKFGLSSPGYISEAKSTAATMDGRRDGEPFSVHISSVMPVAATELLSFAMKLDYNDNRINGNVVDLFATPKTLTDNKEKYLQLLMAAFRGGLYQFQMNIVDSATLIAAKKNPEKFPTLIVRVWGFSAYFKDLPEEYKDLLIKRAIESEKAA